MKHTARLRVLVLALALLLVLPLVACGNDTPNTPDTPDQPSDPSTPDTPTDPEEPEEPQTAQSVLYDIPMQSFASNFEFLVAAASNYSNTLYIDQFTNDDDINGDTVHDALFARDKMIEEYFGIDIYYDDIADGAIFSKVSNPIRSGDDIYSLVLGGINTPALPLFENDLLYDLNTVDTIDLTQPWWNKNSVDAFTINDHIYMATGAITNRVVFAPYGMLVNFRLREAAGISDPYEMVKNSTWTLENFEAMIIGTSVQLNGDDQWDVGDFYGLAPSQDSETAWFFAAGGRMVEKSPSGELWAVYEEEENYDLISWITDMYEGDDVMKYVALYDSSNAFRESRAIFHSTALCDITRLNDMEDKYGFLPMPKLDESQEEYYSNTNRFINTMALLPTSVQEPEKIGAVIEALAAVSQFTSLDKQYDTVLLNRRAVDADSKENLKIIVESSLYDMGYVLNPANISYQIRDAIYKNFELGSVFASLRDPVEAALEEYASRFAD